MNKSELLQKITSKVELSQLPKKDVKIAFEKFNKEKYSDEEKIKLTRAFLMNIFSFFSSRKIFSLDRLNKKNEEHSGKNVLQLSKIGQLEEWYLKKQVSTRERFEYYSEIYKRILGKKVVNDKNSSLFGSTNYNLINNKNISIIDLGCGINGFSYKFFPPNLNINYVGVEGVGQLVKLVNNYFEIKKIKGKVFHESLFELEKIKEIISKVQKPRMIFLFKVIDSLELMRRDYSKELLKEIAPLCDELVVSFATRSLVSKKEFYAKRNWVINFIKENFKLVDDFEMNGERYISLCIK